MKQTTKNYIENNEVEVIVNIHARYSVGGRVAFEVKHGLGVDVDLGSVTMFSVDISINLRAGERDIVINYYLQ